MRQNVLNLEIEIVGYDNSQFDSRQFYSLGHHLTCSACRLQNIAYPRYVIDLEKVDQLKPMKVDIIGYEINMLSRIK